jgi:hypothetical protein
MKEAIDMHNNYKNWIPVLRSELPQGKKVIPSVWDMMQKRQITDGNIHKWKARLNVDGSKQVKGVNFWETYAPVAQWILIRLVLSMPVLNKLKVKTFDFVQPFLQAPSETELYVDVPCGCCIGNNNSDWVLKVVNNIYGQKQACCAWYKYLVDKLVNELGFQISKYNPCVLWNDG